MRDDSEDIFKLSTHQRFSNVFGTTIPPILMEYYEVNLILAIFIGAFVSIVGSIHNTFLISALEKIYP